jgi:probable HAF family extracellular repeat protein
MAACLTTFGCLGSLSATSFAAPSLIPLGDLPGGDISSDATAINSDGTVIVGQSVSSTGSQAFRWTAETGMVGLGGLTGASGASSARGVSGDGSVVVGRSGTSSGSEGFRWTAEGGMTGIGDLPGGIYFSVADGISRDGSTIVGSSSGADGFEAFRWTVDDLFEPLGFPQNGRSSGAGSVSSDGSMVAGAASITGSGGTIANGVRWTRDAGPLLLDYDLFAGSTRAISDDGSTIVGSSGFIDQTAYQWTQDEGLVPLFGPTGGPGGVPLALSADGSVVVGTLFAGTVPDTEQAFVWSKNGGVRSLTDILDTFNLDYRSDGWTRLLAATGVSDDGSVVTGTGIRNGNLEAFVAVIPEPGAAASIAGLAGVALRRRSRG